MIVHRICKARYANSAFSGEGGFKSGGRWHRMGTPIVYAAATLSLAALELFVHLDRTDSKISLMSVTAEIPDGVRIELLDSASLPEDWRSSPPIAATIDIGTGWCLSLRSVVLAVPSAIVPGELNYLLNPAHPEFGRIRIASPSPFSFDARIWR